MNSWIDRLIDMGLLADVECWFAREEASLLRSRSPHGGYYGDGFWYGVRHGEGRGSGTSGYGRSNGNGGCEFYEHPWYRGGGAGDGYGDRHGDGCCRFILSDTEYE